MHEMSIALAVVDQIGDAARSGGHEAVETVVLRVGELAGVVPDALRFCFELACEDTVLAGAVLLTEPVPGRAHCAPCAREWATGLPPHLCCPACEGPAAGLLSGRELEIAEVRWAPGRRAAAHEEA
ncbi:hydrogenase maturation nickel metallochaperone HypA/HybF [Streptantibioticus silvisoli]|jgi:hydrogenase nickel incorporation protein HypA/HybF|uniref:Hydrogenase maturation factor HypA n=1 Tax=Streptantibioticus silvisoli TaxID=2705255 RepID=A0ABT6VYD3_9ACTN|nr:hydrogenase maturation nickel metallochaperone HypA [Streptantibioticus silvisoli]MDI5962271.1 hydrogenase maturation nickel metallochaperone HypA [Streptantibioticus silvisoli]